MIKLSHSTMIALSGAIWLGIGCMLMSLGLNFIVASILNENLLVMNRPILDNIAPMVGGLDQAALMLIALSLVIGFVKGRFVLAKTVGRTVARILSLPNPANLTQIYARSYYLLLGGMFFLGFIARLMPFDVRGLVDVTIGAALINGAMLYFRRAYAVWQEERLVKVPVTKE